MRGRVAAVVLLLTLLAASTPGLAQEATPVVLEPFEPVRVSAGAGETRQVAFTLFNLNQDTEFFVTVSAPTVKGWEIEADQHQFFLDPRGWQNVTLTLQALGDGGSMANEPVTFRVKNGQTGEEVVLERPLDLTLRAEPRVFGMFENPLPAPLDNEWGVFVINLAAWVLVGVLMFLLSDRIVNLLTRRAPRRVTAAVQGKLRVPVFLFVFLVGVLRSFEVLPPFTFTDVLRKVLAVVTYGVIGVYLLYKAFDAVLFYLASELGPRTTSKLDEVVIPFVRKFGLAIFLVVGAGIVMMEIGWDPTVLFAGAGIAGIAIAFAAQETISNLFSGIFILLDRPFKEGDDIQLETGEIARVERVGLRSTRLYSYTNHTVLVLPNKDLANTRITSLNYPDRKWKINMELGVAYGSDPDEVKRILREVAEAHPRILLEGDDAPIVRFNGFGDSSLVFLLRITVIDLAERFDIAGELRETIYARFAEAGIEIPFPQRTVWLHESGKDAEASG